MNRSLRFHRRTIARAQSVNVRVVHFSLGVPFGGQGPPNVVFCRFHILAASSELTYHPMTLKYIERGLSKRSFVVPSKIRSLRTIPGLLYSPVDSTGAPDHGYKIGFGAPVEFTGDGGE